MLLLDAEAEGEGFFGADKNEEGEMEQVILLTPLVLAGLIVALVVTAAAIGIGKLGR
jgi:hypothetical protein